MAITTINFSDPVSTLVTKTNTISTDLGDVATLVTGDDNVVDAINSLSAAAYDSTNTLALIDSDYIIARQNYRFDSNDIIAIAREGFSIIDSSGGPSLSYDSTSGTFTLAGGTDSAEVVGIIKSTLSAGAGLDFNASTAQFSIGSLEVATGMIANDAITNAKIGNDAVGQAELRDAVTLTIKNSAGTVIKTLYGAGS